MPPELTRREKYEAHLKSELWQDQRASAFSHWGRFCQCCGNGDATQVHHLNYRDLIDCVPQDLMPLCDGCHERLHKIPALDKMARVFGDPLHKRQLVLIRMHKQDSPKEVFVLPQRPAVAPPPVAHEPKPWDSKFDVYWERKKIALRQFNQRMVDEQRDRRLRKKEPGASKKVQQMVADRFGVSPDVFSGWPASTITSIFKHEAVPIFARPPLLKEIAAVAPGESMTLTREDIMGLRTRTGGFTGVTVGALGLKTKELRAGWINRLVGTTVLRSQYLRAMAGKAIYSMAAKSIAV